MEQPQFILASGSPRRRALLATLGIPFAVAENPWNEVTPTDEPALRQVERLAREKLQHFLGHSPQITLPVLTADTLLESRGLPINKPVSKDEAWEIYRSLAGRWHRVLTSVVWHVPEIPRTRQITVATKVRFVPWNAERFRHYLDLDEWRDAAGGYKIQEAGASLVREIRGSWANVVGLPIAEVYDMIAQTLRVPAQRPFGS